MPLGFCCCFLDALKLLETIGTSKEFLFILLVYYIVHRKITAIHLDEMLPWVQARWPSLMA